MASNIKQLLKSKLTKKEISILPTSFDVVGNILIFSDFPSGLSKKSKIIGNIILKNFKNVKSVFKKTGKYSGKYRTPKLSLLVGVKNKETIHKENNSRLKLNVEKVYFSSRLSSERKRIFSQVKKNESILVMFSGVGVYPVVIARNSDAKEIYGVEVNPVAHKYALENVRLNKVEDRIKLFLGDVKKELPKINKKFNRVLMPLPKGAEGFLSIVLGKAKKGGIIHLYTFGKEEDYNSIKEVIKKELKKHKKKCKILRVVKCGQFSPRVFRLCVDFKVY